MAVKLRLRRMGRRKRPLYAVVASDVRSPRDGRYIEDLGRYDSLQEPATVTLNTERVLYWLEEGAQPTDTVRSLLSREGVMLALHMRRKGAEAEAIAEAVAAHRERRISQLAAGAKQTAGERRAAALVAEASLAKEREAELAKQRAAAEAKAKEAADEARRLAEVEREKAAEEARIEQAEANKAQAEADAPEGAAKPAAEKAAEPKAEAAEPKVEKAEAAEPEAATPEADAPAADDKEEKKD